MEAELAAILGSDDPDADVAVVLGDAADHDVSPCFIRRERQARAIMGRYCRQPRRCAVPRGTGNRMTERPFPRDHIPKYRGNHITMSGTATSRATRTKSATKNGSVPR